MTGTLRSVGLDLAFVVADLVAVTWMARLYAGAAADLFVLVQLGVFGLYILAIRFIRQQPGFAAAYQEAERRWPNLLFWLPLGHILALLYMPIGLFLVHVAQSGVYEGSAGLLLAVLFAMLFVPVFAGREIGRDQEDCALADPYPAYKAILLNLGFVLFLAFADVAFTRAGHYLMGLLTREITGDFLAARVQPLWYLLLLYRLLFLWMVYAPIRMWQLISEGQGLVRRLIFAGSMLLVLLNGFLPAWLS